MMDNRLFRSSTDKMLGGVCAGLGTYLRIDVTIVRLFFVVLTMAGGFGPLLYLILWIVLPVEGHVFQGKTPEFDGEDFKDRAGMVRDDFVNAVRSPNQNTIRFIGIALVLAGGFMILKQFNISWLSWLNSGVVWAALILIAGIALLVRGVNRD
jgi:phage shock protein PspC (stress-responsive transcriptional regulator)